MRSNVILIIVSLVFFSFSCDTQQKTTATSPQTKPTTQTRSLPQQTFVAYDLKGNEPYWNVKIEKDKITLRQLGETALVYPYLPPAQNGKTLLFETSTKVDGAKSMLKITMEEKTCSDNMSGERFPYAVKVEKDGKQLLGCGKKM